MERPPEIDLTEAEALFQRGEHARCRDLCVEVLRRQPGAARAWSLMGMIAAEHRQFDKAEALFARAAGIEPQSAIHLGQRARSLLHLSRPSEARALAEQALAMPCDDEAALSLLGWLFTTLGDAVRALDCYRRVVEIGGPRADHIYNLAVAQQFAGDLAAAEDGLRQVVALRPEHHHAWHALVGLGRQSPQNNAVEQLEALIGQARAPDAIHYLGHALAKSCEDLGDHPAALAWLERAKAPRRKAFPYDAGADRDLFAAAAELAQAPVRAGGEPEAAPIFIVGMPRSGTTVVEQILASHSQVVSIGESPELAVSMRKAAATRGPAPVDVATLRALLAADPAPIAERYLAQTGIASARVVDKMPLNLLYAGAIRRAMPNARIVCLRREPLDTCLANYAVLFGSNPDFYRYAYDMRATAQRYVLFAGLVDRLRDALAPDRFTELAYEELVAEPQAVVRRLLDFCGLPWEDACLSFHKRGGAVRTASAVQVRQPLYATSVGRAQRFGEGLTPMRDVLIEASLLKP